MPSSIQTRVQIAGHTSVFASPAHGWLPRARVALRGRKLAENICAGNLREEVHLFANLEEMNLFMERGVNQAERELRVLKLQDHMKKHRSSRL